VEGMVKIVEFRVKRFNPEKGETYESTYRVPVRRGMTILDALMYIKENIDETLTFRYSCRMGICGSCSVMVNGKPMLACYTQILDLGADVLTIEPLANLTVIKDLVVDVKPFLDKVLEVKPYIIRSEEELRRPEEFIQGVEELKRYWDFSLCIKCSVCYAACPASIDNAFLGPSALSTNYRFIVDTRDAGLNERLKKASESVWLCTSCNSCTLTCPKNVDSALSIVEEKRLLVEEGRISKRVIDVLTSSFKYHNPLGMPRAKRLDWAKGLNVKEAVSVGRCDTLLFMCCLPSYDARLQEVAKAAASLLAVIGVDYVVLGSEEEWCCGDHILRMGERGLFEELAAHNASSFRRYGVSRIITVSPHCYYAFKNEKPYTDVKATVQHYTEVLGEALDKGRLRFSKAMSKRVMYHDPCFLGKRSKVYEAPRKILEAIPGLKLVEARRNKENSFCCGGGAGRIWIEEAPYDKRPCVNRVKEAVELDVDVIATSCPFCISTLEDAVKVLEVEGKIAVRDILEIVKETL